MTNKTKEQIILEDIQNLCKNYYLSSTDRDVMMRRLINEITVRVEKESFEDAARKFIDTHLWQIDERSYSKSQYFTPLRAQRFIQIIKEKMPEEWDILTYFLPNLRDETLRKQQKIDMVRAYCQNHKPSFFEIKEEMLLTILNLLK